MDSQDLNNELLRIMEEHLGHSWTHRLKDVITSAKFDELGSFLFDERKRYTVYPEDTSTVFRAFRLTPFDDVRVVILGQDPYHDGSTDGLAFSNANKLRPSPSLKNILKEVEDSVYKGFDLAGSADFDLSRWASQGVLLLNTSLTVRKGSPGSHSNHWKFFTEAVMQALNNGHTGLIYMLWGAHAHAYEKYISPQTNHILKAAHPASVIYGGKGWFGCNHFAKANELLMGMNGINIKW